MVGDEGLRLELSNGGGGLLLVHKICFTATAIVWLNAFPPGGVAPDVSYDKFKFPLKALWS